MTGTTTTPEAQPDSAQMAAMLRAMAPASYDAAMAGLRHAALGLLALIIGAIGLALAPELVPALGLLLAAVLVPLLAVRWWRAGYVSHLVPIAGAVVGWVSLAGAAASLALSGDWVGAVGFAAASMLFASTARLAWRAWNNLGALKTMISPGMLAAVASGGS